MPFSIKLLTKFDDPDFILTLARKMTENLREAFGEVGLESESGATLRALSYIGEPERTTEGWHVVVGDLNKLGDRSKAAPRGTLRAFFDYLEGTGRVWRYTDWQGLSPDNKDLLAQARRAGLFGGQGIDYANYMWVQNYGNFKAKIRARGFLELGIAKWRGQTSRYVRDWEQGHRA